MTLKDFILTQDADFDVYDDCFDDSEYACLCPQKYTEILFNDYAELLNLNIEIYDNSDLRYIVVEFGDKSTKECIRLSKALNAFTYMLAGYVPEEIFNKYVIED